MEEEVLNKHIWTFHGNLTRKTQQEHAKLWKNLKFSAWLLGQTPLIESQCIFPLNYQDAEGHNFVPDIPMNKRFGGGIDLP